jgi:hemoglobin-like flavoprotein
MKLLLVVAVLGCLALSALADKTKCGPLQKLKVKKQWDHAYGEGSHRLEFGLRLFNNMFKAYPKARELFASSRGDNVYSPEFQAISQRVLRNFGEVIESGDDLEVEKVIIAEAKKVHAKLGIKDEYLDAFRDIMLETLPEFVGNHLDWDAWHACFDAIIAGFKA